MDLEKLLAQLSEPELAKLEELSQERRKELRAAYLERTQAHMERILQSLHAVSGTAMFLEVVAPAHETMSCSDEKRTGNYNDHGTVRCSRCFWLDALWPPISWPLGATLEVRIKVEGEDS